MIKTNLRTLVLVLLSGSSLFIMTGCFSEQSFPLRSGDYVRLQTVNAGRDTPSSTRIWLREAHQRLKSLLPSGEPPALLTEDLLDSKGRPIDVLAHFHVKRESLETLGGNCQGLMHSAQLTGSDFSKDRLAPTWPGYEDLWIPVKPSLSLHGYLGYAAMGGVPVDADCVVLLPGGFGHNDIKRTRDLADALRFAGLHVLAIELRGHGRTELKYPDVFYNFGVSETDDLLVVSEWLQAQPHIRRTGMVGFCWGANQALLAAWYENRGGSHPGIGPHLAPHLRPVSSQRHFEAGVIAFSPVLRFEEILDQLDIERSPLVNPVLSSLQVTVKSRLQMKAHDKLPEFDPRFGPGSLRKVIDYEFARSELSYPDSPQDAFRLFRFLPYKGMPDDDKLAGARIPVLIVQAANDPLACAQDVADLMAKTPNPNVAAVVLPGGGHVGFAAYDRAYYFSLILNFFHRHPDPGPVALH